MVAGEDTFKISQRTGTDVYAYVKRNVRQLGPALPAVGKFKVRKIYLRPQEPCGGTAGKEGTSKLGSDARNNRNRNPLPTFSRTTAS
jgi:hypothetical protein